MFVRFSKRNGEDNKLYKRAVSINNTYLMQEGDDIVAYGYLLNNNVYNLFILKGDNQQKRERYFKRFIGNSVKWEKQPIVKKRKYAVRFVDYFDNTKFKITPII